MARLYPNKMKILKLSLILLTILTLTACGPKDTTQEQKLPETTVEINGVKVKAEVVKTRDEIQKGLSGRQSLEKDKGMLFVYDEPGRYTFWMKGMKFPLDLIWIRDDKVVDFDLNVPIVKNGQKLPEYMPLNEVNYVLEVNAGFVKEHGIKQGDEVKIKLDKD